MRMLDHGKLGVPLSSSGRSFLRPKVSERTNSWSLPQCRHLIRTDEFSIRARVTLSLSNPEYIPRFVCGQRKPKFCCSSDLPYFVNKTPVFFLGSLYGLFRDICPYETFYGLAG